MQAKELLHAQAQLHATETAARKAATDVSRLRKEAEELTCEIEAMDATPQDTDQRSVYVAFQAISLPFSI